MDLGVFMFSALGVLVSVWAWVLTSAYKQSTLEIANESASHTNLD